MALSLAQTHLGRVEQEGFTLIELIIVIVILGIISLVAAPKFINVVDDAKLAKLESIRASYVDGVRLIHAKAILANKTTGSDTLDLGGGVTIPIHSGYPVGHWENALRYVLNKDDVAYTPNNDRCEAQFCARGNQQSLVLDEPQTITGRGSKLWLQGYSWTSKCAVYYINNEDGSAPIIGLASSEC